MAKKCFATAWNSYQGKPIFQRKLCVCVSRHSCRRVCYFAVLGILSVISQFMVSLLFQQRPEDPAHCWIPAVLTIKPGHSLSYWSFRVLDHTHTAPQGLTNVFLTYTEQLRSQPCLCEVLFWPNKSIGVLPLKMYGMVNYSRDR